MAAQKVLVPLDMNGLEIQSAVLTTPKWAIDGTTAAAPTIASAGTITPTTRVVFVSGVATINTITPPATISATGGTIVLIPTGLWATGVSGNISLASTAVVGQALSLTYDSATLKWYPSLIPGAASGSPTLTTVEKDLGPLASRDGSFDITGLSGLVADKQVIVNQSNAVYTGKGTLKDEVEMDQAYASGYVLSATSIRVRWACGRFGVLKGNVKFNYLVSA